MFNEKTWKEGELLTQNYLRNNGYKIISINYKIVGVELDIVSVVTKARQVKILKQNFKKKIAASTSKQEIKSYKMVLIQMIKQINPILVITEVKARANDDFGMGAEAVGLAKQKHIIRGAKALLMNPKFANYMVRFDVSSVDNGVITYIENAFYDKK